VNTGTLFIWRKAMSPIAIILGAVAVLVLLGVGVALMLASAAHSEKNRKAEVQGRRIAHQPWDAQSAHGRGNR
jgi:flagellar basal body-associated protein FliL